MNEKKLSPALYCFFLALLVLSCPDIAPAKTVTVKGYVKDAQGSPLEAVKVQAVYERSLSSPWGILSQTDENGYWSCELEEYVRLYRIEYAHPDFVPRIENRRDGLEIEDGAFQTTLQPGFSLEAMIFDANGLPVDSGEVRANKSTYPIKHGVCTIRGLLPDPTKLTIIAKDHALKKVEIDVHEDMKPIQISLDRGQSFSGSVVDVNDHPIADVTTSIYTIRRDYCVTDAHGQFRFDRLPLQGQLEISLNKKGFRSLNTDLPGDLSKPMKYVLQEPAVFMGKVVDSETDEPVQSFNLLTEYKANTDKAYFYYVRDFLEKIESTDGSFAYKTRHFSTSYPYTGLYNVRVEADGYLPKTMGPARVGEKVSDLVISLKRGSAIHGTVTGADGRPTPNAQIALVPSDQDASIENGMFNTFFGEYCCRTDESGQFRFIPIEDQEASLLIALHQEGYALVQCDDYQAGTEIRLIPWSCISGRLGAGPFSRQGCLVTLGQSRCLQLHADPRVNWYFESALLSGDRFTYDCVPAIPLCIYLRDQDRQYEATHLFPQPGENCQVEINPQQSNGTPSAEFPPELLAGRALPWHPDKRFAVDPERQTVYYESQDWQMLAFPGQALPDLSDLALQPQIDIAKDRALLICFMDLDQRPSRHCAKVLAQNEEELKAKGIQVILISSAEGTPEKYMDWIKQNSISYPVCLMHGGLSPKTRFEWRIRSLPCMILTDEKRVIQAHGLSLSELVDRLNLPSD